MGAHGCNSYPCPICHASAIQAAHNDRERIFPSPDIAQLIVIDLQSRSGFDSWWEEIDDETKNEIIDEWTAIIKRHR